MGKIDLCKISILIWLPILILAACDPFNADASHPSDEELIRNFQKHEADFNKLVGMSNEDSKVIRIAPEFTRLKDNWAWPRPDSELGFSRQRWEEYKTLFHVLGLKSGLSREPSLEGAIIFMTSSSKGMTFRGSSKGYAYSDREITPLLNSLDEDQSKLAKQRKHGVVYKRISDRWYLSYDW